jgi:hypothetical protein
MKDIQFPALIYARVPTSEEMVVHKTQNIKIIISLDHVLASVQDNGNNVYQDMVNACGRRCFASNVLKSVTDTRE